MSPADLTTPTQYRVDVLGPATVDLAGIFNFYLSIDSSSAAVLVGRLLDASDTLQVLPYRCRVYQANARPARVVRVMQGPASHLIYYRVLERSAVVIVMAYRHAARRPPTRFSAG